MSAILLKDGSYRGFELIGHKNPYGKYPNAVIPIGILKEGDMAAYIAGDQEMISFDDKWDYVKHSEALISKLSCFDYSTERLFAIDKDDILVYSIDDKEQFFGSLLENLEFSISNPLLRLALAEATKNNYSIIRETLFSLLVLSEKVSKSYIVQWYEHHLDSLGSMGIGMPTLLKFTIMSEKEGDKVDFADYLYRLWKRGRRPRLRKNFVREPLMRCIIEVAIMSTRAEEKQYPDFLSQVATFMTKIGDVRKVLKYLSDPDNPNDDVYLDLKKSSLPAGGFLELLKSRLSQILRSAEGKNYPEMWKLFRLTAEQAFAQKQGSRASHYIIHYEAMGRGRPIILLHSWVGSWRYWIPTMQVLSASFRVYALDLWGYGDTAHNPSNYSVDNQSRLLDHFLTEIGINNVAIIGHGLGALVGFRFASRYPERVDRFVAVNSPLNFESVNSRLWTASPLELKDWLGSRMPEVADILSDASKVDPQAIAASMTGLKSIDIFGQFNKNNIPCLLVYGQRDPAITKPSESTYLSPMTHQVAMEESGHFPMVDSADRFNRLLTSYFSLGYGISPSELGMPNARDLDV